METIHRTLGDCPLPDARVCRHLAMMIDNDQWPSRDAKSCANCSGLLCPSCKDDAVHCSGGTCLGIICAECQATARKRERPVLKLGEYADEQSYDYLCSPCCDKQDAASSTLTEGALKIIGEAILRKEWLDDIVAKLEEAIDKAREAL